MLISVVTKTKLLPYRHFHGKFCLNCLGFVLLLKCSSFPSSTSHLLRIVHTLTGHFGGVVCIAISLLAFKDETLRVRLPYVAVRHSTLQKVTSLNIKLLRNID
jgi:hypothetical protein